MEPRFEVRFRYDRPLLRAVFRASRRWLQPALWCYAAATGAVLSVGLIRGERLSTTGVALFFVFAAMAWSCSPQSMARTTEKRHRKRFGGELPEVTVCFSDEDIRLRQHKDEQHFEYARVERIIRRDGLSILRVAGRLMIPLPDGGFTRGTPEAFAAFIRTRCPEAK